MKKLLLVLLSLFFCGSSRAQDVRSCSDIAFRQLAWHLVSEGNRQYDRSYRSGIKMYADSLELVLKTRYDAGMLHKGDSLEFTADLLKLRADWHYENGGYDESSYAKAEALFRQAISLYTNFDGMSNDLNGLPMLQREMAQLMYKVKRYDEALAFTDAAYQAYVQADENIGFEPGDSLHTTMLELKSQKAMCLARTGRTDEAIGLINELLASYPKTSDGYHEVLRKKGKILMLSGRKGCASEALELYKDFLTWRKTEALTTLGTMTSAEREGYWMRVRPFVADCYQLDDADPAFLYDVTLFAKGLLLQINRMSGRGKASEEALASLQHTWTDIQSALPENACAIEFVQYEKADRQLMGAIVLSKTGTPKWVQMMAPDDFYGYQFGGSGNDVRTRLADKDLYRNRNRIYGDSLFCRQIWSPVLVSTIGNTDKIYFAPDGYLQQLAIEYMDYCPCKDAEIFRLSSTRRLLEKTKVRTDRALIVGDVDYMAPVIAGTQGNDVLAYTHFSQSGISFGVFEEFGTESQAMMLVRGCQADTVLNKSMATEDNFLNLCNSYPLLICSTHGHFSDANIIPGSDIKTNLSDESLSYSILAFAGINRNATDENFDRSRKDGILSAREISECNMEGVDLAVLSACQTGLGYISSDGVFGLQRGFKNAGVGILFVSLWEVNFDATQLLILGFLHYMREGFAPHSAFLKARSALADSEEALAERYRIVGSDSAKSELLESYEYPYYQDAFIMIDAIE